MLTGRDSLLAVGSLIVLPLLSAAPLSGQQATSAPTVRAIATVRPSSGERHLELVEPLTPGEIAAVERRLVAEGGRPGEVDGRLDEATRAALRAFQRDAGLRVCGCLDPETVRALGLELRVVLTRIEGAGEEDGTGASTSAAAVEVVYPTTTAGREPPIDRAVERPEPGSDRAADHGVEDVTRRPGRAGVGGLWGGTVLPIPVPVLLGPDGSPLPPDGGASQRPSGERGALRPAPLPRVPMPPIRPRRNAPD